jgi:hypothetical protein
VIRLVATLATAGLVIFAAGRVAEPDFDPASLPFAEPARRVVELVGEAVAKPPAPAPTEAVEPEPPVTVPVEEKAVPVDPAPAPLLEPGRVINAPEPFFPDVPEETVPHVVEARAPEARRPLDRESADQVRVRLDRVMSLASGKGR